MHFDQIVQDLPQADDGIIEVSRFKFYAATVEVFLLVLLLSRYDAFVQTGTAREIG